jgi:hypothetical protein
VEVEKVSSGIEFAKYRNVRCFFERGDVEGMSVNE